LRIQILLASWKGKSLSCGGRFVLINMVLTSLPMLMLSFFEVPKGVRKRMAYYISKFIWLSDAHKRKYRLSAVVSVDLKVKAVSG
jgi:magnesium-transporting ATPase (P-type)